MHSMLRKSIIINIIGNHGMFQLLQQCLRVIMVIQIWIEINKNSHLTTQDNDYRQLQKNINSINQKNRPISLLRQSF